MSQFSNKIKILNRDALKFLALFFMAMGRIPMYVGLQRFTFLPHMVLKFCICAQMFAPPVFFFFISEGFVHTKSKKAYAIRLGIFACISQIPYYLCVLMGKPLISIITEWSVIASLFAGLMCLIIWESGWKIHFRTASTIVVLVVTYLLKILAIIAVLAVTYLLNFEWFIFGPLYIMGFYFLRKKPVLRFVVYTITTAVYYATIGFNIGYAIAMMASIIIITFLYNGNKGHFPQFSKWFFYIFYPMHLLIPYLLKAFVLK